MQAPTSSDRTPTLIVRPNLSEGRMAVRLWNIGGRQQFTMVLQRFRSEFILARSQKIEGLDWLILMESQLPEVTDFCRRYELRLVMES